jgi:murein DD-endopeptidase MepM/ murein hydrolase activator NlpD
MSRVSLTRLMRLVSLQSLPTPKLANWAAVLSMVYSAGSLVWSPILLGWVTCTYTVSGSVRDISSDQPLVGIPLFLVKGLKGFASVKSDDNGNYSLSHSFSSNACPTLTIVPASSAGTPDPLYGFVFLPAELDVKSNEPLTVDFSARPKLADVAAPKSPPALRIPLAGFGSLPLDLLADGGKWLVNTEAGGYGHIGSPFADKYHNGNNFYSIDFDHGTFAGRDGTVPIPVLAAARGKVVDGCWSEACGLSKTGFGYRVKLKHDGSDISPGYTTLYAHLKSAPSVSNGSFAEQGQLIGFMGTTGASTGVHLHFEVAHDDKSAPYVDFMVGTPNTKLNRLTLEAERPIVSYVAPTRYASTNTGPLIVPNGGEIWRIGKQQELVWYLPTKTPGTARIELSRDSGTTWEDIVPSVANNKSKEPWLVSGISTVSGRMRITSNENSALVDTSDRDFIISPDLDTYDGFLDSANCTELRGWAWDATRPNDPIDVDIFAGSTKLATVTANLYRKDLANKGNGMHAFQLALPPNLKDGDTHVIYAAVTGIGAHLNGSGKAVTCGPAKILTPEPGTLLSSSSQLFTWTSGNSVDKYDLRVGSTKGGSDIFDMPNGTNTSVTVSNLPIDGRTVYVRLRSLIGGNWYFNDYTYLTGRTCSVEAGESIDFERINCELGEDPGTPLASRIETATAIKFVATVRAQVFRNAGGTLDFYYQISNASTSTSSIGRSTEFSFDGVATQLFYRTDTVGIFINGTEAPLNGDRSSGGVSVGFSFTAQGAPDSRKIDPGESTRILVIRTDARHFTSGFTSVINSGTDDVVTFAPAADGYYLHADAQANIWGAGGQGAINFGGGIDPPGITFDARANQVVTFRSVTGETYVGCGERSWGPDGDLKGFDGWMPPMGRLSGINFNRGCSLPLIGVFLGPTLPDVAPASPDFTRIGYDFDDLSPELGQLFFIGDGLTGEGSVQRFHAPDTATRLYIGFVDSPGKWGDNKGAVDASFSVLVEVPQSH